MDRAYVDDEINNRLASVRKRCNALQAAVAAIPRASGSADAVKEFSEIDMERLFCLFDVISQSLESELNSATDRLIDFIASWMDRAHVDDEVTPRLANLRERCNALQAAVAAIPRASGSADAVKEFSDIDMERLFCLFSVLVQSLENKLNDSSDSLINFMTSLKD